MKIYKSTRQELPEIKRLYKSAFPAEERKPFRLLQYKQRRGVCEILTIDDGGFAGLAVSLIHGDIVLIDYYAIGEQTRGRGTGSRAIAQLCERYVGKRVVLEIEAPDDTAENGEQRVRRKRFYLRNGFEETGILLRVYGTDMELLTHGGSVSLAEYVAVLRGTLGRLITAALKIKRIGADSSSARD